MAQFITDTLAARGKKQDGGKAQYITDALASGASGVPAASNSTIKDPVSYALANVGLGIAGIFEGAGDLIVGTAAQLTGNKAYAEYLHKKNVTGEWRGALDSVYKPGRAMTFVGDVGQGIGQSSAFLLDAVAPGVGTSLFFGGVAGRGVSEASQITGELGAKEYVYGAAAGAVEGLLEKYVGAGGQLVGNLTGKVGGNITRGIVSKIAKETAGQAVSKGIIKGMISAGAGEFAEEFLSEYADTFLRRATGVDKNAEYSLGNAVYSGMVGFASGAFLGGAAKSINTAVSYNSGKRVIDGGNADTLVKTAKVVGDSFESDGGKGMPEALTLLKKSVEKYGDIKDKSGAAAAVTLGEIKAYLAMTETYAGVREVMATLDKASDSAVAEYAKYMSDFTGKAVSAEDFRSDKDNVKSDYAVQAWASLFLSDSKAEAASRRFNDIIAADTEGRAKGAPVVQELSVSEWQGGDAVFSLPGGEYVNIMTAEDGLYSLSWGRTADDVRGFTSKTAEQVRDILAKIKSGVPQTAAGSTQDAQGVGGAAGQATAQTVAGQAQGGAQGIYTAQVQDAARAAVKDFDTLSPGVRRAVMDWVRSADGVDGDIVSSVGFIMSVRPGLQVLYAKLGDGHRGLYANLPDIDRRLIVASGDASAVRETLAHELAHDMRSSVGWNALRDAAMEAVGEGEMAKIAKLYRDTLGLDDATIEEEIVAKTVGKMLTDRKFLERYAETGNIRKITRAARSLFEYIASRGADRVTLAQSARIMRIMDGIIAIDYVMGLAKGKAESDSNAAQVRYNIDTDSEGNKLTPDQREFFKDSKVRDEDGRLLVVYHGTNANFTVFNKSLVGSNTGSRGFLGSGFYVTTKEQDAVYYGNKILKLYVNAKNLLDIESKEWTYELGLEKKPDTLKVIETRLEDLGKGFYTVYYKTDKNPAEWEYLRRVSSLQISEGVKEFVTRQINPESRILPRDIRNLSELAQNKGYDGIISSGTNFFDTGKEIVVFSPEQIKLTTNKNPTADPDIRYNLDELKRKYADKTDAIVVTESDKNSLITLSSIRIKKELQKQNIGTQFMKDLVAYADSANKTVTLTPSTSYGATSINRLKEFYKRFGFVENKGKHADFRISDTMYRLPKSTEIKYDLDETDRRYMSAVESGDTETAQKMVDEAARKAGYTIKAYHGTNAKFNTFRFNPEDLGIHAGTKSQARAKSGYGKNAVLLNVAYKLNNPIKFDKDYGAWDSEYIAPELVKAGIITKEEADYILLTDSKKYKRNIRDGTAMLRKMLIDKGYDGFQYPNWYEGKLVKTSYAVFKRDNIKSADPVTYDDAGSVIPLSKRFATDIPDIRYDLDMKAKANDKQISELQKLADKYKGQAEYWKKQTKRTTEPSVEEKAVAAKARELRRRYNSRAKDTKALLQQLYDTMAEQSQTGSLNADELYAKAHAIADGILSESYERSVEYEIFSGIRSYVLGNKLKVSDAIKGDFDNWADWMRNNVPFVVSNKGVDVDAAYAELSEIYGEKYFPAEIVVPAEQLRRIAEMTAYSKDKMLPAEYEDMRQEARTLALNILDDFLVMPYKKPTFADKQAGKLEMVKSAARVSADADRVRSVITKRKTRGILGNEEYNAVLTAARRIKPRFEIIPGNARAFADAFVTFLERHAPEVVSAARSEAQSVHEAYNNGKDSNQILQYIDPYTVRELEKIKSGEGALTAREMRGLHSALTALLAMDGRVDKMYKDGKWVDVAPRSARVMDYLRDHYGGRVTATQAREIGKLFTTAVMNTLDPEDVTRIAEGVLSDGTLGDAIHELKLSDERANRLYDRYTERTDAFMRENKEFTKSYHNDKVELTYTRKGADGEIIYNQTMPLTKGEAMQLYMTAKREQAKLALAMGRVRFSDNKRSGAQWRARIIGAIDGKWYEGLTDAEFAENVERMAGDIERAVSGLSEQFTKQDREFIEIMEDYYNRLSRNDKQATDDILWGKTNVVDGYYVPISRSEMARDVDLIEPRTQDMTVRNLPFNKDTVKGASAQLVIRDAYDVMKLHAKQMSRYVHMTIPLMNFQRLYNHRSDTATDNVFSIREYISTYGWAGYERYITDYFQDAQGLRKANEGEINKALRFIKSNTAKFYIGANIGSMAKQMSSVLMMMSVVGRDAWVRGMKPIHADKIDTYSVAAANRNSESAMYFAQGVGGTLGKVGNITMKPMKWGDRAAVQLMWSMVQHEVAIKEGLALGTEENFKRAGSMLDDAILLVQDTGAATTKTGVARHQQEIVSAFSMFRSAPSKMFSRLYLAGAEVAEVAKRKKAGRSVPESAVGRASKRLAVIGSAVLTVALYESVVGLIRNAVRGKDDEEDVLKTLSGETALNLVGLVPVAGQIAENWLTGYDVSLFHLDLFNDTRKALDGVMTISDRAVSGEYVDDETIRRNARNVVYAFGRLTGIPTRNIHNIFMSALSPSKSAQYKANALFSDTGMTSALQKAIEGGDEKLARTVIDTLYNKRTGAYNTVLSNKIADLYSKGYTNVLAIKLPTVYKDADGAEVKVSARQYKDMESIYSQATAVLSRMVLDPRFTGMSEAAQARAISVAFRAYHNKAKSEVLGADRTQTVSLMGVADPLTLFIEGAYISSLGGDKKAQAAQARVARYDKVTQAAILYACGYKSMSIKSTLSKAVDSNTAQTLNLA